MTGAAPHLLIVTGMSGAGRSTVADALEDLGWYVVDNLPPLMLRPLIDLGTQEGSAFPRIAVVVDVRGGSLFDDLDSALRSLREGETPITVMFLDADDDALVRRFEQVRRPHPLHAGGTILDGIRAERAQMAHIRESADIIIDTSRLNVHQLTTTIQDRFREEGAASLSVTVQSFGYKYGIPADADIVLDARFLPNPFWIDDLKPLTGLDERVSSYVLGLPGAIPYLDAFGEALRIALDGYRRENKRNATIAIGCTGGKHRSVAIAEELARRLAVAPDVAVTVRHRDLGRE